MFLAAIVTLFLFLCPSVHAQIDANGNGLSDLYERSVNSNANFPSSGPDTLPGGKFHPDSDPDGDGVPTKREAVFGTDCFSPQAPAGFFKPVLLPYDPLHPQQLSLAFPTIRGKRYTPESSITLADPWTVHDPLDGTGGVLGFTLDTPDEPRNFVRLRVADLMSDADAWLDYEEYVLGTDPFNPDTDRDGIFDHLDPQPLVSATKADPDNMNLAPSLATNLRAFYDFETTTGTFPYLNIPDRSGNNRHATTFLASNTVPGMPSMSGAIASTYIKAPVSAIQSHSDMSKATWSISGWFRMEKDSLKDAAVDAGGNSLARTLYAVFERTGQSANGVKLGKGYGLFLRRTDQGETWFIGSYLQSVYFNEPPNTNGNPKTVLAGATFNRPLGTSDDGGWHHFVVTRNTLSNGSKLYLDGELVLFTGVNEQTVNYTSANTALTFGRLHPDQPAFWGENGGFIDRVRVHGRVLTAADVLAYYHQDTDNDGLWDVTETNTGIWSPGMSATKFFSDPLGWQDPATSDVDRDGALDVAEQTLGTKIAFYDTDSDGLPDGWEMDHGLDPKSASGVNGTYADEDGDGLSNFDEWQHNSDPKEADTDHDGVTDKQEVDIGSDPNRPSDTGSASLADGINVPVSVGDPSESHSEKWTMTIRGLGPDDWRQMRLASPDFGQMATGNRMLRKGNKYEVTVTHAATDPAYLEEHDGTADYDWQATIDGKPTSESKESFDGVPGVNNFFTIGGHWLVDNRQAVFTTLKEGETDLVTGHLAYLHPLLKRDEDVADGNWQPISGQLAKALPGQKINLRMDTTGLPSAISLSDFEWVLPGTTFKDYTANQNTAVLTQIQATDLKQQNVHFYFADSGSKTIQARFKVNGAQEQFSTVLDVERPVASLTTSTGRVRYSNGTETLLPYVGYYPDSGQAGGMNFTGSVQVSTGGQQGKWNWVQLVTTNRSKTDLAGDVRVHSLNGVQALDTRFPYRPAPFGSHPGNVSGYSTGSQQTDSDSPALLLDGFKGVEATDYFELYLMFMPFGAESRFVPLKRVDWSWHVSAATDNVGSWHFNDAWDVVGIPFDTPSHPIWNVNVASGNGL